MSTRAGGTPALLTARKSALRAELRHRRSSVDQTRRQQAARSAAKRLLRLRPIRRAQSVAIYLSNHSELDTTPLLRGLLKRGQRVYVPVTTRTRQLRFVRLHPGVRLRRGRFGILQPATAQGCLTARRLQVIVLPLLGFDSLGYRLGQGGGYYDRTLAPCRHLPRPLRIGYAYAVQQMDTLPRDPWDVPLDAVVTESGLHRFPRRAT